MKVQLTSVVLLFLLFVGLWSQASFAQSIQKQMEVIRQNITDDSQEIDELGQRKQLVEQELKVFKDDLAERERVLGNALRLNQEAPSTELNLAIGREEREIELVHLKIRSRVASMVRFETKVEDLNRKISKSRASLKLLDVRAARAVAERLVAKQRRAAELAAARNKPLQVPLREVPASKPIDSIRASSPRLRSEPEPVVELTPALPKALTQQPDTTAMPRPAIITRAKPRQFAGRPVAPHARPKPIKRLSTPKPAVDKTSQVNSSSINSKEEIILAPNAKDKKQNYTRVQLNAISIVQRINKKITQTRTQRIREKSLTLSGNGVSLFTPFEHLGGHQYRAQAVVRSGKGRRFEVDGKQFKRSIPPQHTGEMYIFYYDASSADESRLFAFPQSLLPEDSWSLAN